MKWQSSVGYTFVYQYGSAPLMSILANRTTALNIVVRWMMYLSGWVEEGLLETCTDRSMPPEEAFEFRELGTIRLQVPLNNHMLCHDKGRMDATEEIPGYSVPITQIGLRSIPSSAGLCHLSSSPDVDP